jgi:hypothetical protein
MVGRVVFKAQAYELKMTILFFVYFGTPYKLYKSIQFIHKPVFLFWFFPCCCFGFTNKAATTKNRQIIYDLSMLCLGLGCITDGDTIQRCIIWERIPTKKWRRTCFWNYTAEKHVGLQIYNFFSFLIEQHYFLFFK